MFKGICLCSVLKISCEKGYVAIGLLLKKNTCSCLNHDMIMVISALLIHMINDDCMITIFEMIQEPVGEPTGSPFCGSQILTIFR